MSRRIRTAREQYDLAAPWRLAAVTQSLVDQLHGEFKQWHADNNPGYDDSEDWTPGVDPNNVERGPIGNWKNVENFMQERYPAAHRGHSMGLERAKPLLDISLNDPESYDPQSDPRGWRRDETGRVVPKTDPDSILKPYETGPDAYQKYGYDPSEIAAGMMLLHNQSHPFRGDLAQEDQDRLNSIFQKRQKMQRDYDSRQVMAAFDPIQENFGPHYRPGKDPKIDAAANAYAMWAGRLDDSNFDRLSANMVDKINQAGFGPHTDPYDAMMEFQGHLRRTAGIQPNWIKSSGLETSKWL